MRHSNQKIVDNPQNSILYPHGLQQPAIVGWFEQRPLTALVTNSSTFIPIEIALPTSILAAAYNFLGALIGTYCNWIEPAVVRANISGDDLADAVENAPLTQQQILLFSVRLGIISLIGVGGFLLAVNAVYAAYNKTSPFADDRNKATETSALLPTTNNDLQEPALGTRLSETYPLSEKLPVSSTAVALFALNLVVSSFTICISNFLALSSIPLGTALTVSAVTGAAVVCVAPLVDGIIAVVKSFYQSSAGHPDDDDKGNESPRNTNLEFSNLKGEKITVENPDNNDQPLPEVTVSYAANLQANTEPVSPPLPLLDDWEQPSTQPTLT